MITGYCLAGHCALATATAVLAHSNHRGARKVGAGWFRFTLSLARSALATRESSKGARPRYYLGRNLKPVFAHAGTVTHRSDPALL